MLMKKKNLGKSNARLTGGRTQLSEEEPPKERDTTLIDSS
jgi:hypothetical protein